MPFLNKEGYGAVPSSSLKLCKSVEFCKSRSICCIFMKQRWFCFKQCYLPNAILLLARHIFATLVFLHEVQNAQNRSLVYAES